MRANKQPRGGSDSSRAVSLWRQHDFIAFWLGETVSGVGTQVTFIALPLVAVVTLNASTDQVGLLRFAEYLPYLIFTLPFGVLADRYGRRRLMLVSYVVRSLVVGVVPLLAALGVLEAWNLAAIAFVVGTGSALFEVCWLSYLPSLVDDDRIVEAMGNVAASHSAAESAGPGVGGLLVQLLTAPFALVVDAASYLVAVLALSRVRRREPMRTAPPVRGRQLLGELAEGLRFAFSEPHIRATALAAALGNFFTLIVETTFLVYAIRELHLSPALLGLVLTSIGAGGLVGALIANGALRRWPVGAVCVGARVAGSFAVLLLPLAGGSKLTVVVTCMAGFFLCQAALASSNVISGSLRQMLTEDRLRGRMNASVRTLVYGALPLGSLTGGALGGLLGLHATLWLGAIGYAATIIPIVASPIPRLRTLAAPTVNAEDASV